MDFAYLDSINARDVEGNIRNVSVEVERTLREDYAQFDDLRIPNNRWQFIKRVFLEEAAHAVRLDIPHHAEATLSGGVHERFEFKTALYPNGEGATVRVERRPHPESNGEE